MTKNQKGFVVVGVIAALAAAGYFFFKKNNAKGQVMQLADKIVNAGLAAKAEVISTFEQSFLKAWYDGYTKGGDTFVYQGKTYNVKGGRAVS